MTIDANAAEACRRVRDALGRTPTVADWWVTAVPAGTGHAVVAYVVPNSPGSQDGVLRALLANLGPIGVEVHVVRLCALPRDADGQVVRARLAGMPVVSQLTLREAERIARLHGATQARAVLRAEIPGVPHGLTVRLEPQPGDAASADEPVRQRQRALSVGPTPRVDPDRPATLPDALRRAATGERGIVLESFTGSPVRIGYAELLDRATRTAYGLIDRGLRPGTPVIMPATGAVDFFTGFWACQLAGLVPVPASAWAADPSDAAAGRLRSIWQLLDCPVVLTADPSSVPPTLADQVEIVDPTTLELTEPVALPRIDPTAVAIMMMTSGSTGMPKLVVQTHRRIMAMTAGAQDVLGLGPSDVDVNWFPLDHVVGILMCHVRDVYLGCEQVHAPTAGVLEDPLRWIDLLSTYAATLSWAPNFAFALVSSRQSEFADREWRLGQIRLVINAGEMVVAEQVRRFIEVLEPFGFPSRGVLPAWGMSETCSVVTCATGFDATTASLVGPVDVGAPFPGISMRIVREDGSVAEEGETGALQVAGATVLDGYYRNPKVNAESFTGEWFDTGDLAVLLDGSLTIVGRSKNVIRVNSMNIGATEVEAVAERATGAARSFTAAVAYRPDGAATDQLVVFFAAEPGHGAAAVARDIRRCVVEHYGFAPAHLIPVDPETVPKTSIGKIRRADMATQLAAGAFDAQLGIGTGGGSAANQLWLGTPTWLPRPIVGDQTPERRRFAVVADDPGMAARVVAELTGRGRSCTRVLDATALAGGPGVADGAGIADGETVAAGATELILVPALAAPDANEPAEVVRAQADLVHRVTTLALGASTGGTQPARLTVLAPTRSSDPADDLSDLVTAPLLGLMPSLGSELDGVLARVVFADLDGWVAELLGDRADPVVAYHDGVRDVPMLTGVAAGEEPTAGTAPAVEPIVLQAEAGYVVSGGLGGVGYEICRHLLRTTGCALLLLGRTPLAGTGPEAGPEAGSATAVATRQARLRELERTGRVRYAALDAADRAAVQAEVVRFETDLGVPVAGALHLAGLIDEVPVGELDRTRIEAVLQAKIAPAMVLGELVAERKGFLIAFSSVNAIFGGVSVASYAAANAALGPLAGYLRRSGCQTRVLSWSRWRSTGMSAGAGDDELVRSRGYRVFSAQEGLRAFTAAMACPAEDVVLGVDPTNPFMVPRVDAPAGCLDVVEVHCDTIEGTDGETTADLSIVDALGRPVRVRVVLDPVAASGTPACHATVEALNAVLCQVLGVSSVPVDVGFFELGAQSLHLPRIQHLLAERLGVRLATADFFEWPTAGGLAARIDALLGSAGGRAGVRPGGPASASASAPAPAPAPAPATVSATRLSQLRARRQAN